MKLLIDGYNLLGRSGGMSREIEEERESLLSRLSLYQRKKKADITVIFDGWDRGFPVEKSERYGTLSIIFSKQGEKADQVIKRRIESARGVKGAVVSSDREIAYFAQAHGWDVIPSPVFEEKVWEAFYELEYGKDEGDDDGRQTPKKGNPRRLSKAERKKHAILKKL